MSSLGTSKGVLEVAKFAVYVTVPIGLMYFFANNTQNLQKFMGAETEKVALAESTGLDQKQINNWFINQRKRHWKPSEDMQFMVMDGLHPQNAALFVEGHYMGEGPYRLGP